LNIHGHPKERIQGNALFQIAGSLTVDTHTWFRGLDSRIRAWIHDGGNFDPTATEAPMDNGLYALMVFTLPGIFGWGIDAVWWIKLATAVLEMIFCVLWLRWELRGMDLEYHFPKTEQRLVVKGGFQ